MSGRYAIYFAPLAGSDLARFGDRWLGRDVETGKAVPQPVLDGLDADRLRALTEAPRHYGFHGTLKPPFHLAKGCDVDDLRRAMAGFAARQAAFEIAALQLREIGDFLALVPADPAPALSHLADACVDRVRRLPRGARCSGAGQAPCRRLDAAASGAAGALGLSLCAGRVPLSSDADRVDRRSQRSARGWRVCCSRWSRRCWDSRCRCASSACSISRTGRRRSA